MRKSPVCWFGILLVRERSAMLSWISILKAVILVSGEKNILCELSNILKCFFCHSFSLLLSRYIPFYTTFSKGLSSLKVHAERKWHLNAKEHLLISIVQGCESESNDNFTSHGQTLAFFPFLLLLTKVVDFFFY